MPFADEIDHKQVFGSTGRRENVPISFKFIDQNLGASKAGDDNALKKLQVKKKAVS